MAQFVLVQMPDDIEYSQSTLITVYKMAASSLIYHYCSHDIITLLSWLFILLPSYLDQIFTQTQTWANTVTNHTLLIRLWPCQSE